MTLLNIEKQEIKEQIEIKEEKEIKDDESKINEPTIIFIFDMKNWFEIISPVSKLDLIDIIPLVSSQFYIDFSINAYVLILTKIKWDSLNSDVKRKFMFISRRIKSEMEGPMTTLQNEIYENSDIFELLMGPKIKNQQEQNNNNLNDKDLISIEEDDEEIIVPE